METLARAVALLAAGYVAVAGGLVLLQRSFQYFPGGELRSPEEAGVPEMDRVRVQTSDGLSLEGWYAPAGPGRPTLAYFHGNGGNLSFRGALVRPYLDAGFGVFLVGYRGYGGNPGKPSEQGFYWDARAALDFLEVQGVAPARTVLVGESIGTGVAVQMATERDVGAVILDAPFTSTVDLAAAVYWMFPVRLFMWDRYENLDKIGKVRAPVMVLHGTADAIIPVEMGRRILDAAAEQKQGVFPDGAGHSGLAGPAAADVITFLDRHLAGGG